MTDLVPRRISTTSPRATTILCTHLQSAIANLSAPGKGDLKAVQWKKRKFAAGACRLRNWKKRVSVKANHRSHSQFVNGSVRSRTIALIPPIAVYRFIGGRRVRGGVGRTAAEGRGEGWALVRTNCRAVIFIGALS